jgi:hypothetical protein
MWWNDDMKDGLIARSVIRQLKFRRIQCLLYASMISTVIFIALQFIASCSWSILWSILSGIVIVFLIQGFSVVRFFRMIKCQEKQFGIAFSDRNASPIGKNTQIFLSDDWFILAGTAAFYRKGIKDITWRCERHTRGVRSYYLIVVTSEGGTHRYRLNSKKICSRIRRWWKADTKEETYEL